VNAQARFEEAVRALRVLRVLRALGARVEREVRQSVNATAARTP